MMSLADRIRAAYKHEARIYLLPDQNAYRISFVVKQEDLLCADYPEAVIDGRINPPAEKRRKLHWLKRRR
jgi:hypothetical protein